VTGLWIEGYGLSACDAV